MRQCEAIKSFRGEYDFLSNFYPCNVEFAGVIYPTLEHAFQAAKTTDTELRKKFLTCPTAYQVKRMGKEVALRPDWEQVKFQIMRNLVRDKFTRNESHVPGVNLRQLLLDTGDAHLEEGNNWNDLIWGTVNGRGQNNLGKILMEIREELQRE